MCLILAKKKKITPRMWVKNNPRSKIEMKKIAQFYFCFEREKRIVRMFFEMVIL